VSGLVDALKEADANDGAASIWAELAALRALREAVRLHLAQAATELFYVWQERPSGFSQRITGGIRDRSIAEQRKRAYPHAARYGRYGIERALATHVTVGIEWEPPLMCDAHPDDCPLGPEPHPYLHPDNPATAADLLCCCKQKWES
jgi:hypothetical protein